ncbi:hypothetical protein A2811_00925 [Candidatus Campbellbacteria bacterium RIFCSPHIGHO2_01_FULL_34_10]|nr:MAG: hypothetical protein A2811_00925 [Candidatus Campbellbacteria bacterium RIFCSPHIGHO2_01_FULL_34_10]
MKDAKFKLDFIGIGVPRSGTTWIHNILKDHPQICMSSTKETNFFNDDNEYNKGISYYQEKYYKHCDNNQIRGEFHPGYFNYSNSADRIKNNFPNSKVIICLRNPVDRAYSHFSKHELKGKKHLNKFSDITKVIPNIYIDNSTYSSKIKKYISVFGKNNILILFYNDLIEDPQNFSKKIYNFLGVSSDFTSPKIDRKINFTGERRAKFLFLNSIIFQTERIFIKNKFLNKYVLPIIKKLRIHNLRKLIFRLNMDLKNKKTDKKEIDEETKQKLIEIFNPDIEELEKITGKDLSFWKQ